MKLVVFILLAVEALLVAFAMTKNLSGDSAILLLAGNSVLLIWAATRLRRKPSCCR
jgi:hypothetical protein